MLAPGAEEFLEPLVSGLWVPPERTFLGVAPLVAERTHHYEVAAREGPAAATTSLAFRGFYQVTGNQQVAVFGLSPTPAGETGHYVVGNGGDVSTSGWEVGHQQHAVLPCARFRRLHADAVRLAAWRGDRLRPPPRGQRRAALLGTLNDVTTAVEADMPITATHVFLAYRVNTGFARREPDAVKPGLDARFDVQVMQRLPFLDFTSARWQVMLAVRNLFRDTLTTRRSTTNCSSSGRRSESSPACSSGSRQFWHSRHGPGEGGIPSPGSLFGPGAIRLFGRFVHFIEVEGVVAADSAAIC